MDGELVAATVSNDTDIHSEFVADTISNDDDVDGEMITETVGNDDDMLPEVMSSDHCSEVLPDIASIDKIVTPISDCSQTLAAPNHITIPDSNEHLEASNTVGSQDPISFLNELKERVEVFILFIY